MKAIQKFVSDPSFCAVAAFIALIGWSECSSVEGWLALLLHPWLMLGYVVTAALFANNPDRLGLSDWNRARSNWFLFTGLWLDVIVYFGAASLGWVKPIAAHIGKDDARFTGGNLEGPAMMTVGLTLTAPLALLAFRAIRQRLPSREFWVVAACASQLSATFMYLGAALYNGSVDLVPASPIGVSGSPLANLSFQSAHLLHFWIPIGIFQIARSAVSLGLAVDARHKIKKARFANAANAKAE